MVDNLDEWKVYKRVEQKVVMTVALRVMMMAVEWAVEWVGLRGIWKVLQWAVSKVWTMVDYWAKMKVGELVDLMVFLMDN